MKKYIFLLTLVVLFATCKKKTDETPALQFSIGYNGNGNTGGTIPTDGNAYDNGSSALILGNTGNLVKTNFSFIGWNTAANGSGIDYFPSSSITFNNSNITLYAKWVAGNLYMVTYNGNGNTSGSAPVDNTTYASASQVTVKNNTGGLTKNGNSFIKWNTTASGSGQNYLPGSTLNIVSNLTLYAIYNASNGNGGYFGFNASGQLKSKSSLSSSWISQDLNNTFGSSNVVSSVWNGSKFVGFNASGQTKSKSSSSSSWISEDLNNTFGSSNIVAVVWNGSKYIGFNASGQTKSKSTLSSSWISEDLNNTFGSSNLVAVVWNGSKYIGFNASGQVKSKSTLSSSWISEDLNNTFGSSNVVTVAWNGSKYIGFNASGQAKSKSTLSSSWISEDLNNTFGSSNLVSAVYY